ncbi:MAG: AraC family ligand binding domain-containing protein [Ginsengibacter sp.]
MISGAYITDIGYYPKARHHYRERIDGIDQNILIYCLEGQGTARIKKEECELNPGNFVLIPEGTAHQYGADEPIPGPFIGSILKDMWPPILSTAS